MNDDLDPTPDPLNDIMAGRAPIVASDSFRQTLLRQTRGVVRRRRMVRRAGFVGLMIVVFSAGALTMRWVQPPLPAETPLASNESISLPTNPIAPEVAVASPLALEWQAIDSTDRRADLFRQAGDRYLTELGDMEGALRCYRNVLDLGTSEDTAIRPDDSWLMISLKQAKLKEKFDESLGS
jgi:hypothetical protein